MKPFAIPSTAYTHLPSIRAAYARAHPQQGFVLTELVIAALIFGIFALGVAFAY
ncbi:MAG: prepilin-type N-terminal cleavage/methylation domain-containing protein, partial [Betaproteobacteria bacterium]|nr:prepilin-type N-terminal cleavage/methylation domain-containing protein [Betaproteobacteria bacterium]